MVDLILHFVRYAKDFLATPAMVLKFNFKKGQKFPELHLLVKDILYSLQNLHWGLIGL